ncbi:MAG: hypothetical protein J6O88_18890 [Chryseobacterium sp.]|uniref:hypothetical protein n=1 Tax=Chryseobacterium sp. TaxID=1871047 RepID=UPI001B147089|nr:hypothetical protein [Chryseobacterium sp.]MBO6186723.1 hypothetical protein [Chryseobacterium sp.]
MSNLSNKTEYKALTLIAQIVKDFEKLHYLEMTKEDDGDAKKARNLLECIVESNGYKINYNKKSNQPF